MKVGGGEKKRRKKEEKGKEKAKMTPPLLRLHVSPLNVVTERVLTRDNTPHGAKNERRSIRSLCELRLFARKRGKISDITAFMVFVKVSIVSFATEFIIKYGDETKEDSNEGIGKFEFGIA